MSNETLPKISSEKLKVSPYEQKRLDFTPLPRPTFTKYTYKPKNSNFQTSFLNNRIFNRV